MGKFPLRRARETHPAPKEANGVLRRDEHFAGRARAPDVFLSGGEVGPCLVAG
jgi:hypothetical protein